MKIFTSIVIALVAFFVIAWVFNHINAWAGIGTALLIIFLTIKYVNKKFQNEES